MAVSKPQTDLPQMKIVTCPLCSDVYKSPKTLPCLHSFCEKCIHDFIISIGKAKENENKPTSFNCPICRTVVRPSGDSSLELDKWVESLPGNTPAELIISQADGKKLECVLCKGIDRKSEAKHWCCQCEDLLCDTCSQFHRVTRPCINHFVVSIENAGLSTGGIYFNAIKDVRCSHQVKKYCSTHEELFCIVCHEVSHRTCKGVTSLDETLSTDELCSSLPANLAALRETVENLVKERKDKKERFEIHVQEVESEAKLFIDNIKSRLGVLYEAFVKELSAFREDENIRIDARLCLLEQLTKALDHWITVTDKIKGNATETQILALFESIKNKIETSAKDIRASLQEETIIYLNFERAKTIADVEVAEAIGTFGITEKKSADQMQQIYTDGKKLGLFRFSSFKDVEVEHIKQIRIPSASFRCGVSIDQDHSLVGNVSNGFKLQISNMSTGTIVSTTIFPGDVRRVCFDKGGNRVFISCNGGGLYSATVGDRKVSDPVKIAFNTNPVGGLCMIEKEVYVVAPGAIKSFDSDLKANTYLQSIHTNTENELNGLGTYDGHLIFTTKDKEVKCSTITGKGIFSYKSPDITSPQGLAILPLGSFLVLDTNEQGKLHLVSADGQRHRTLLEKFENVTTPQDVWLSEDKSMIYVCGGEYIDIYRVQ